MRNFIRSKSDPLVVEVELLDANPKYALIRHKNGIESTVSVKDLAPCPPTDTQINLDQSAEREVTPENATPETVPSSEEIPIPTSQECNLLESSPIDQTTDTNTEEPPLRRSGRIRRAPDWYGDRTT